MYFLLHYAWGVVFYNEYVLLRRWTFPMECWGGLNNAGEHGAVFLGDYSLLRLSLEKELWNQKA